MNITAFNFKQTTERESGAVLVTALMFLTVLTLIGVVSMQTTALDFQMSRNTVFKDRAFYASENARVAVADVLDDHLFERGWTTNITLPTGLTIVDTNTDLYSGNITGEDLANTSSLTVDLTHQIGTNSSANIMVYQTQTKFADGAGLAMLSGYSGLGKSAAAGGVHVYFELRSRGTSTSSAQATTATEYRAVLQN